MIQVHETRVRGRHNMWYTVTFIDHGDRMSYLIIHDDTGVSQPFDSKYRFMQYATERGILRKGEGLQEVYAMMAVARLSRVIPKREFPRTAMHVAMMKAIDKR